MSTPKRSGTRTKATVADVIIRYSNVDRIIVFHQISVQYFGVCVVPCFTKFHFWNSPLVKCFLSVILVRAYSRILIGLIVGLDLSLIILIGLYCVLYESIINLVYKAGLIYQSVLALRYCRSPPDDLHLSSPHSLLSIPSVVVTISILASPQQSGGTHQLVARSVSSLPDVPADCAEQRPCRRRRTKSDCLLNKKKCSKRNSWCFCPHSNIDFFLSDQTVCLNDHFTLSSHCRNLIGYKKAFPKKGLTDFKSLSVQVKFWEI